MFKAYEHYPPFRPSTLKNRLAPVASSRIPYADAATNETEYTYDLLGRLTSVTDQAGTLSLDYDERGLVTAQDRVIGGNTYTTDFTYESAGRYASVTYPDAGWVINYARDNAGQVSGVTATEPGQSPANVATSITYLPFGPVSGLTHGNGLTATFTHDLDYRTTGIRYSSAGGNIYYTSNTWNANNNLTTIVDNVNATNNQDLTYDVIDRLTYASSGAYTSSSITYDSNSNRLTYGGTSYTIDSASNRMTAAGGSSITYTSAGNISAIGSDTLVYNKANQLATATVSGTASTYVYDAFGQRLTSTVGGGTPVIQQYGMGGLLLSETQGSAETNYVYLNGLPVAAINTASPALSYIHTNHLGTPQKATNSGQSVVWSGAYQPFGAVTPTTSITQNLRFPGQYADPTNLNYNMFRNYNPALGRYMESDPIGLAGGLNTYNYALNNPYKYTDPDGLFIQYLVACAANAPCRAGATFVGKQALSAGVKYYNSVKGAPVPATLNNDANDTNTTSPEATQAQEQSVIPAPTPPEDPNCKDGKCGDKNPVGNLSDKIQQQMKERGWTEDQIKAALDTEGIPTSGKKGPATRYVDPTTGKSLVVDNQTGEIFHVGKEGYKY